MSSSTTTGPPPYSFVGSSVRGHYNLNPSRSTISSESSITSTSSNTYKPGKPRTYHVPNYAPGLKYDETSSLIPVTKKRDGGVGPFTIVLLILLVINTLGFGYMLFRNQMDFSLDPIQREHNRENWDKEWRQHQKDHEEWERERREHDRERERLERERRQRKEEQDKRRDERHRREEQRKREEEQRKREEEQRKREEEQRKREEERRRLGLSWDEPMGGEQCVSYATREYTARLWKIPFLYNWDKACQETAITIHGITLKTPDRCEDRGIWGGMHGHWFVNFSEPACLPYWGDFEDKGCTSAGSRLHRIEARLWNIQSGDWKEMCATTPADIHGTHFDKPKYCDDKAIWGIYGIWEIDDPGC